MSIHSNNGKNAKYSKFKYYAFVSCFSIYVSIMSNCTIRKINKTNVENGWQNLWVQFIEMQNIESIIIKNLHINMKKFAWKYKVNLVTNIYAQNGPF